MDMMDGFYQILMREIDIKYTAVTTLSHILWEWLVMPQGLATTLIYSTDVLQIG